MSVPGDWAAVGVGAALGLPQLWLALSPARPPALRRVSLWAALALLGLAGAGLGHRLGLTPGPERALLAASLIFGALWLRSVFALSKQNTTM